MERGPCGLVPARGQFVPSLRSLLDPATPAMDALTRLHRSLVGGDEEDQPDDILADTEGLCSLSPLQRIYAFAACLVAGLALMILSFIVFARPIKFAVMFTFGNILAVGSTAFVMGPQKQLRMMFDPVRLYATAIYAGCVVLALIFALWIHDKLLTLIAIICEICALFWYSLSYIPFARRMVSDLMVKFCDTEL
ncbi:hypothetical protein BS78_03G015100 [Paspalum vaginatum]|nr:hypothetical protein BS78_03G015100 [Paspalum vaginatum]